jgi:hypothetical protein
MVSKLSRKRLRNAVLALFVALFGCGGTPGTLTGPSIDGQVVDAHSSKPLPGAHVYYLYESAAVPTSFSGHNSPDICYHAAAAVSDDEGRFHIDAWRKPQKYNVDNTEPTGWAYAPGYIPKELPPKEGVHAEPKPRANDVFRLKASTTTGEARLDELWRFAKWGCLHGGDSQRSLYPALRAAFIEARTVATAQDRERLDAFRFRAATAQVAPDPVADGENWTGKIRQFVNEKLQ